MADYRRSQDGDRELYRRPAPGTVFRVGMQGTERVAPIRPVTESVEGERVARMPSGEWTTDKAAGDRAPGNRASGDNAGSAVTFSALVQEMQKRPYPMTEDPEQGLRMLGLGRSCAAAVVLGLIQKGVKGDVNAAKLLRELNGEEVQEDGTEGGLEALTDAELRKIVQG